MKSWLLALFVLLLIPSAVQAVPVLNSPLNGFQVYADESIIFDWGGPYNDVDDYLYLRDTVTGQQLSYREILHIEVLDANTLSAGQWAWHVCNGSDCSAEQVFEVLEPPRIDNDIAEHQFRKKVKRKWHATRTSARCVENSETSYLCTAHWQSRRVKYVGYGSVLLYNHKYDIDVYVSSRTKRR
jgi:hypothetical protein